MMKRTLSMLLALILVLGLAACGSNDQPSQEQTPAPGPANSLEVLTNIWGRFAEEEKFSIFGGNPKENYEENIWEAPGNYDLADPNMSYNLLIPADQIPNVDDVASMTHGMMANNFTAAVFHVKSGVDVDAFTEALFQSVSGNMWICGMPERAIVATIGQYVVMAYGVSDPMESFQNHLYGAYPDAVMVYNDVLV